MITITPIYITLLLSSRRHTMEMRLHSPLLETFVVGVINISVS